MEKTILNLNVAIEMIRDEYMNLICKARGGLTVFFYEFLIYL